MPEQITKIYLIEDIDINNPNLVYIGKTKNSREGDHKKKYGNQIKYNYIDEVNSLDRKDWESLERYWIEQFRQWGFILTNKNKGGGGPSFRTEEFKAKKREFRHTEESKQKISNSNLGKKRSEVCNQKMSKLLKNRVQSEEEKLKKSISSKGKPKPLGFGDRISLMLKGKSYPSKWKKIIEINSQKEYKSIKEAAKELGINTHSIVHILHNRVKQTRQGFIFKYI